MRELAAATDVKFKRFGKSKATLYLNSFKKWEVDNTELSMSEYIVVLKRICDFLKSEGFEMDFNVEESIWQGGLPNLTTS